MENETESKKKKSAIELHRIGAIKFGNFTLSSGKSSPYYVDLRIVPSYPELFDTLTDICADIVEEKIENKNRIAGVPTGGLPYATLVSYKLSLPLFYVRKKRKKHGRKKGVEGVLEKDYAVLIDDVTTTGGSIKKATETIRSAEGKVKDAIVMLDREESAKESLQDSNVNLESCFKISEIIEYLKEDSIIDEEKYTLVRDYLEKSG